MNFTKNKNIEPHQNLSREPWRNKKLGIRKDNLEKYLLKTSKNMKSQEKLRYFV